MSSCYNRKHILCTRIGILNTNVKQSIHLYNNEWIINDRKWYRLHIIIYIIQERERKKYLKKYYDK